MLKRDTANSELFKDISLLSESLGLSLVEVSQDREKNSTSMRVVLASPEREITTDDLEKAYNIIYPRYQVLCDNRDLNLEVSSPGLQRSFKDVWEFKVFKGKNVRVYSSAFSSYVVGRIGEADEEGVVILNYLVEDKKESGESIRLDYDSIAKAKLECIWEEKND